MEYLDYRNTGRPVHGAHWLRELPEVGGSVLDLAAEIEAVDREIKKLSELRKVLEDRAMKEALANWEKNEIEAVIPRTWVPFTSASQAQPGRRMKAPDYTGHGICTVVALQKQDGRRCIIIPRDVGPRGPSQGGKMAGRRRMRIVGIREGPVHAQARMATVTESARADGRGHWPAGKRRNSASGRVEALKRLERYRIREGLSIRGTVRLLSVSDRAVRRWLSGEHWSRSDLIELIRKRCVLSQ